MIIRVGTSGYAYREWKGSFYPKKIRADAMLGFYASRFEAVEINNSFYQLPESHVVSAWAEQTHPDFRFVLKAPQKITHFSRLKGVARPVASFLKVARTLGPKQGPLLFQLPPNFKKDMRRLRHLLAQFQKTPVQVAIEFRNPSWFDDEVYAALRASGVALAAADTGETKLVVIATAPFGYFRLRDVHYTNAQLAKWADAIRAQPWKEAWVFFKHEDKGRGPKLADRLLRHLGSANG